MNFQKGKQYLNNQDKYLLFEEQQQNFKKQIAKEKDWQCETKLAQLQNNQKANQHLLYEQKQFKLNEESKKFNLQKQGLLNNFEEQKTKSTNSSHCLKENFYLQFQNQQQTSWQKINQQQKQQLNYNNQNSQLNLLSEQPKEVFLNKTKLK